MPAPCPTRDQLDSFQAGDLDEAAFTTVASHVESCPTCQRSLETLIGDSADTVLAALLAEAEPSPFAAEPACRVAIERVAALAGTAPSEVSPTTIVFRGASTPIALDDALPLETIREYKLLAKIGEGGMGAVYKALHTRLDKVVALKVLPQGRMRDGGSVARFQREMKAVGRLDHPNIVRAMDAGEENGTHFLVMEYVEGADLSQLAKNVGPLPVADACELVRQAALGLQEAHEHGMVHRDIKPSNLILAKSPRKKSPPTLKILDLGLALLSEALLPDHQGLTYTGQMMGTIDYIAPEQGGDSHQVDIRADIYSLGATLYKLLTGSAPFSGEKFDTPVKKILALATQEPLAVQSRRADVPPTLAAIVHKMLAKDPANRYATPDDLIEALTPCCQGANLSALLERGAVGRSTAPSYASEAPTHAQNSSGSADTAPTSSPLLPLGEGRGEGVVVVSAKKVPKLGLAGFGRKIPRSIAIAAACGGAALAILLGVVFYLETLKGTIRVEIHDKDIMVVLDEDSATFKGVDKNHAVKVKAGPHGLRVTRGDLTFDTQKFELRKGETLRLSVKYLAGKVEVVREEDGKSLGVGVEPRLASAGVSPPPFDVELLQNSGCEEPMVEGRIPGWLEFQGRWRPGGLDSVTPPREGKAFFHTVRNSRGELAQDVDVATFAATIDAGKQQFKFAGHVRSYEQDDPDLTRVIVEYRDATNGKVLDQYDSGLAKNVKFWKPLSDTRLAPVGTRWIRVRLISIRTHAEANNGYFDGLSLRAIPESVGAAPIASPVKPLAAIAPFNAAAARKHQEEWAEHLGVPVEYENTLGMKFIIIPPGEFAMGSTPDEMREALKVVANEVWRDYIKSAAPQHKVILTLPIYVGVHEVTQGQYEQVMGKNPSHFASLGEGKNAVAGMDTTRHPVEMVSWNDAAEFCEKLSPHEKLKPFYFRAGETVAPLNGTGYRLPTEAQWEFACRAGTTTKYWTGDRDEGLPQAAWINTNSGSRTHAVGELKGNPFGLYDVHGNIWEWVQDEWEPAYYGQFQERPALDPRGPNSFRFQRVIRGGRWNDDAPNSRASDRGVGRGIDGGRRQDPADRRFSIGFRVALTVDAVKQAMKYRTANPAATRDYALHFGDTGETLEFPDVKFPSAGPWTVEGWVTSREPLPASGGSSSVVFLVSDAAVVVKHMGGQGIKWSAGGPATKPPPSVYSDEQVEANKPVHVALTCGPEGVSFYLNGALQGEPLQLFVSRPETTLRVCQPDPKWHKAPFHGELDEIRVSSAVRYREKFTPKPRFETDADTLALYHFDEGEGVVLKDSSGKDRDGKITEAKWVQGGTGSQATR